MPRTLKDAYGNPFRLYDLKGPSGTLVMFICNHCRYVRAIADRIARDVLDLQKRGVGVIEVMPNDYVRHPDDAPEQMKRFAKEHDFSFPYVVDEMQEVVRTTARRHRGISTADLRGEQLAADQARTADGPLHRFSARSAPSSVDISDRGASRVVRPHRQRKHFG